MKIIKDDILIAEFMELEIITDGISFFDTSYKALRKYNSSWNELMPVLDKIESLGFNTHIIYSNNIANKHLTHIYNHTNLKEAISTSGESKLQVVYENVVKFIQWYNKEYNVV